MKNYSHKKLTRKIAKLIVLIVILTGSALTGRAQLNPFQAIYFQNRYIYNPSMAGLEADVVNINTGFKQQWSSFPGTPKTSSLTVDYQPLERVGVGININDDQAGLIKQTRIMGTYAYHLPLSDNTSNKKLNFGFSIGVDDSRVNYDAVVGDITDQQIALYNQLKPYIDGDFGISYTSNDLYIGGAIPNLKAAFFKESDYRFDADRMLFIATASYKIPLQNNDRAFLLEPIAAFRIVKGYKDIVDAGFNFTLNNYGLYIQGVYHTSRSLGAGFGLDKPTYGFKFFYNVETGALGNYTVGAFELGINFKLFKNKIQ